MLELQLPLTLIIHTHTHFLVFLVLCVPDVSDCWFLLSASSSASSMFASTSSALACPLHLPDSSCRFGFLYAGLSFDFPAFRLPPSLRVHQHFRDTLIQQRGPKYIEENCCILKTVAEAEYAYKGLYCLRRYFIGETVPTRRPHLPRHHYNHNQHCSGLLNYRNRYYKLLA